VQLGLGQNKLEGTLPASWARTNMTHLWLWSNRMSGPLPSAWGNGMKRMKVGGLQGHWVVGLWCDHAFGAVGLHRHRAWPSTQLLTSHHVVSWTLWCSACIWRRQRTCVRYKVGLYWNLGSTTQACVLQTAYCRNVPDPPPPSLTVLSAATWMGGIV
jgi:hypothetical protein